MLKESYVIKSSVITCEKFFVPYFTRDIDENHILVVIFWISTHIYCGYFWITRHMNGIELIRTYTRYSSPPSLIFLRRGNKNNISFHRSYFKLKKVSLSWWWSGLFSGIAAEIGLHIFFSVLFEYKIGACSLEKGVPYTTTLLKSCVINHCEAIVLTTKEIARERESKRGSTR